MQRTRSKRNSSHGFTLIESMAAIGILAFGLLTLAVLQLEALSQGSAGRHTGDASAAGRTALEQAQRIPWAVLSADVGAGWVAPSWTGALATVSTNVATPNGGGNNVERAYTVNWRVQNILDGGGVPNPCLRDIEVRIAWTEANIPTKSLDLATRRYNWGGAGC